MVPVGLDVFGGFGDGYSKKGQEGGGAGDVSLIIIRLETAIAEERCCCCCSASMAGCVGRGGFSMVWRLCRG